ncbi:MAG TPA: hypothetical protein VK903_05645 [Propionicimonas sp.]|nr:hypothetical protein [Propionicimonas sp.]
MLVRRTWLGLAAALLLVLTAAGGVTAAHLPTATPVAAPTSPASPLHTPSASPSPSVTGGGRTLRVYSNNLENLVRNDSDGACTQFTAYEHLSSILVDDAGRIGTSGVEAPDLLLLQQVSGASQAQAYADELSARFGVPGAYRALLAWDDPEGWGRTHDCRVRALAIGKSQQTNAIIYNSRVLALTGSVKVSAGWLKPGTAYANGRGCTTYEPPSTDADPRRTNKWKRTTALAARFVITGTSTSVFAATLHLPQQNRQHACAGDSDAGVDGSGIRLSAAAEKLLRTSTVRVLGVDANRTGLAAGTLAEYGVTGYGTGITIGRSKIDYLFVRGEVRASAINHTVPGTRSNHLALYGFIDY